MSGFIYEQQQYNNMPGIEITGYDGSVSRLFVPGKIEELPVRSIGRFAFAGRPELEEVHLPANLYRLSLFAFQNCVNLRSIELYNTTEDYYDGVIRACTSLKDITVHCILKGNFIIVREMLRDTDAALRFHLLMEYEGENKRRPDDTTDSSAPCRIDLTFPEYVSEAQEDTMARAIHFSIEGAGMAYRECVTKHSIDFFSYDKLFGRLTDYDFEAAADICIGRLLFPVSLSVHAREQYETWLESHAAAVIDKETREHRADAVRYLTQQALIPMEQMTMALENASRQQDTEICSILMDYQNSHFAAQKAGKIKLGW